MFSKIKSSVGKVAYFHFSKEFPFLDCPECNHHFSPPVNDPDETIDSSLACPGCGFSAKLTEWTSLMNDRRINPTGPIAPPEYTEVKIQDLPNAEMVCQIPESKKVGGVMVFGVIWSLFCLSFYVMFLSGVISGEQVDTHPLLIHLFGAIFVSVGLVMIYAGLLQHWATRLLYVGRERVRLQTDLFGFKKIHDLPAASIQSISRTLFYEQNYQPIYGVEISTKNKKIRFGSALTDSEQKWLCWLIKEKLHSFYPDRVRK